MSRGTILVVDDQDLVREVLQEFLATTGFDVMAVASGIAALDVVDTLRPDLVLLDMSMPEMSGLETLRRLRLTRPTLPVLLISGHGETEMTGSAMADGATDFLQKPVDLSTLEKAVLAQLEAARATRS